MTAHGAASYTFVVLPLRLAVCTLPPDAPLPGWATSGPFFSITRTDEELSVICPEDQAPAEVKGERNWVCLKVQGPFDFTVTGVLAALASPLAAAGIPCLAIAAYETDYLLVKTDRLADALAALRDAGHFDFRI
ncbi:MAG TPA: ACT domain-containing protein [Caldilineaceae bacterium]|nr:ACT domain-containing protein [Caldilineaceae bacterium]